MKHPIKSLILEPDEFSSGACELLESFSEVDTLSGTLQNTDQDLAAFHILIGGLKYRIDNTIISNLSQCLVYATPTTGTDHIDEEALKKKKIKLISLKGRVGFLKSITPTAELVFGLILELYRNISAANRSVIYDGTWNRNLFIGQELKGKTLGIIGFGRLGKILAGIAQGFQMNIIFYDIEKKKNTASARAVDLDELYRRSHIISLHIPLNEENHHFINTSHFNKMKKQPLLINTSRGAVVCETELLTALKEKQISGAGLDVLSEEILWNGKRPDSHPLIEYAKQHSSLIFTPHIGGATREAMQITQLFVVRQIRKYIQKEKNSESL